MSLEAPGRAGREQRELLVGDGQQWWGKKQVATVTSAVLPVDHSAQGPSAIQAPLIGLASLGHWRGRWLMVHAADMNRRRKWR